MNIIVCIKQVPAITEVKIDKKTNTLIREGIECIINPFDMYALEEGLRIKERCGGKVTVISMGPPQVIAALREAISLGVDEGILLSDKIFAGADTLSTSYTLSKGIEKIGNFDLIICGKQAIDGDTAQVGPGLAKKLNIPYVTYVRKVEEIKEKFILVERMVETGFEVVKLPLPALITVVKEINEPRLPSLKGMMKSKKTEITVWRADNLNGIEDKFGLKGSSTQVINIFTPPAREGGEMIIGDTKTQVAKLVQKIRKANII